MIQRSADYADDVDSADHACIPSAILIYYHEEGIVFKIYDTEKDTEDFFN